MNPAAIKAANRFPALQPGDVLLYGGGDIISRLIQFRTWSDVAHVEIYVDDGRSVASRNGIGVGKYPIRFDGLRYVLRPINPIDLHAAMRWFDTVDGTPYGWTDLLQFYLINLPGDGLICSQFADLFTRAGNSRLFSVDYPAGRVSPRDYLVTPNARMVWKWEE